METKEKRNAAAAATGVLITILGGCLWGFSGACGQYLFDNKGVTAEWLVPVRLTTAGSLMLIYHIFREKRQAFRIWKNGRDAVDILIYGLAGLMLCQYTYFETIELSNAGTATVIQYIFPVIVLLISCVQERRQPHAAELLGLFLAIAGIFLIATHGDPHTMAVSKEALITGLISAGAVVVYNMQPKRLMQYYPTPYLLGWGMTVGGIVLSCLFKPWQHSYQIDAAFVGAFCGVVILGTIVAFTLYMQGVKLIGPARASLYACIEPIGATVLSAVWLKVPFQPVDLIGFAFIIAMIVILAYEDLKKTDQKLTDRKLTDQ